MAFGNRKHGGRGAHFAGAREAQPMARQEGTSLREGSGAPRPAVGPDPLEEDTPRPVGPDAMATGSFERLDPGQGAVVTTRENASDAADAARNHLSGTGAMQRIEASVHPEEEVDPPRARTNRRAIALLVVLTTAVILGGAYLFSRLTAGPVEEQSEEEQTEQLQTSTTDSIEYHGTTYRLTQGDDAAWHLVRQSGDEGTEEQVVGDLPGTPVTLVLYNGAIVIPENKADGTWDVMAYVFGSDCSQVVDDSGNAYTGQGTVSSATLEGSELSITTDSGTTTVPLNW